MSIINMSRLERTYRIDTEFYKKENLTTHESLEKLPLLKLAEVVKVSDGNHMSISEKFSEVGIPYYRGQDIHHFFIEDANPICIDGQTFNLPTMKRSHLFQGDVLLSIVGTIGGVALVGDKGLATCNCKLAILRPNKIDGFFLSIFLKSKYGQNQIRKFVRGAVQMGLILEDMDQILIPVFSEDFQIFIKNCVGKIKLLSEKSKQTYAQAEKLLLQEIGLVDDYKQNVIPLGLEPQTENGSGGFEPPHPEVNYSVKSFKDSFVQTGRLDAEYYQLKYEEIEKQFDNYRRIKLSELVNYPISSGITPKAGGDDYTDEIRGIPFVRAVDLQDGQVSVINFNYIKPEIHNGILKRTQLKNGDVLFSIAGTVGRCAVFKHDFEANINQAVAILRFDEDVINRFYLMVLFNSPVGKSFVEKYSRQGLQTNLNLTEVGDLSIPIIEHSKQQQIAKWVEESFALKQQASQLLEAAKRAVEIAIEQNEEAAMAYLQSYLAV